MIESAWKGSGRVSLVAACVFALVLVKEGHQAYVVLQGKAQAQAEVTESIDRWKNQYLALRKSADQWQKNYRSQSSVQDIVTLLKTLDLESYGLSYDPDKVVVVKASEVEYQGMQLGLLRIGLQTSDMGLGGGGFSVQAHSYQELFDALQQLAGRQDIQIGNISIRGDQSVPTAVLGGVELLLRKDY